MSSEAVKVDTDKVVTFRPVVDDGAVVYVNGAEVARFNMPMGAVTYSTMAVAAVGNANYTGPFSIPSSALVAGGGSGAVGVALQPVVDDVVVELLAPEEPGVSLPGDAALVLRGARRHAVGVEVVGLPDSSRERAVELSVQVRPREVVLGGEA